MHTVEIAFSRDGSPRAPRRLRADTACTAPGPYRIPNIHSEFRAVYTNLQPTSAVRGAGRPQGVLVMERMMDRMAQTLGLDPAEVALPQPDPRRRALPCRGGGCRRGRAPALGARVTRLPLNPARISALIHGA